MNPGAAHVDILHNPHATTTLHPTLVSYQASELFVSNARFAWGIKSRCLHEKLRLPTVGFVQLGEFFGSKNSHLNCRGAKGIIFVSPALV